MNRSVQIVLGLVVVVVIGAACFYGGMLYGKGQGQPATTQTAQTGPTGFGAPGQGGAPGVGQGGRGAGQGAGGQGGLLSGTIQSIDNGVVSIVDSTGKLIQIRVTNTTLIQKQASVNVTDLQKGETVMVSGTQAADGSYTARSVQVAGSGLLGAAADATPGAGFGGNFPPNVTPGAGFPGNIPPNVTPGAGFPGNIPPNVTPGAGFPGGGRTTATPTAVK